jgi:hypothetical protein
VKTTRPDRPSPQVEDGYVPMVLEVVLTRILLIGTTDPTIVSEAITEPISVPRLLSSQRYYPYSILFYYDEAVPKFNPLLE